MRRLMEKHRLLLSAVLGVLAAILVLLALGGGSALGAGARYVSTEGRDTLPGGVANDCTSPSDPCRSVQRAVNAADSGDGVRVATGVYTDLHVIQGMTQTVYISRPVTVRGGYSADFTTWDPDPSATVLDAREEGRAFWIDGGGASPATIEALQLKDGSTPDGGGAVYAAGAQVTISGCETLNANAAEEGGAIFLRDSAGSRIVNTAIVDTSGIINGCGGICIVGGNHVTVDRTDVSGSQGTGILVDGGEFITVSNSVVRQTQITYRAVGGIAFTRTVGAALMYSHIFSNTAFAYAGVGVIESDGTVLIGNQVSRNQSGSASGIYIGDSKDAQLVNNIVWGNSLLEIEDSKAPGILIDVKTGFGSGPPYDAVLRHNTIVGNLGGDGTGIYVEIDEPSTVTMTNNIIVSQTVGVYVTEGNTATLEGTLWGAGEWANDKDWDGDGTVLTGTVNLWELPRFAAPQDGDYHLSSLSAAIDAGVESSVTTDIDLETRPQGSGPDIGADEVADAPRVRLPLVLRGAG
jgi:hypothetical protein